MERIGRIVYPGRWPAARVSAWNVARRNGIAHIRQLPGMTHNTPGGYMDRAARTSGGERNPDATARVITSVL